MTMSMDENKVSKSKFKARALAYFRWVRETGQPLVITDRGRPVIKVVPYQEDVTQALEVMRGSVLRYDDPTEPTGVEDWEVLR